MEISTAAITAETILKDIHTLEEAKDFARGMRETAIVVGNAHGEDSALYRSVYDRYWDFVDEMVLKFAA